MLVMERWQSWSIASDLKSDEVQASVGSNPTFSDKYKYANPVLTKIRINFKEEEEVNYKNYS